MPAKAKAAKELYFRQRLKSRGKQVRKISFANNALKCAAETISSQPERVYRSAIPAAREEISRP